MHPRRAPLVLARLPVGADLGLGDLCGAPFFGRAVLLVLVQLGCGLLGDGGFGGDVADINGGGGGGGGGVVWGDSSG